MLPARAASGRLSGYLALALGCLLAAVALGRPEPVALAAPLVMAVALGLRGARVPDLDVTLELSTLRTLEGETVMLGIDVTSRVDLAALVLEVDLPRGLIAQDGAQRVVRLSAGVRRHFDLELQCRRWGVQRIGGLTVWAGDPTGLVRNRTQIRRSIALRVYPRPEQLSSLAVPRETQPRAGNLVSRVRGEGIEFQDIRAFQPGDLERRINWRASARRDSLQVNDQHQERAADTVIFLDSFLEVRGPVQSTLDMGLRAAATLAGELLSRRDRVGLIGFGGTLRWLTPGGGQRQLYKIVDALLDTDVLLNHAWKGLEVLPPRTLPAKAQVIALTPLLDDRSITVLGDIAARGFDLTVIEISPLPFAAPAPDPVGRLARRLWTVQREGLRHRFHRLGVPVLTWRPDQPLEAPMREARRFRRSPRVVRAL